MSLVDSIDKYSYPDEETLTRNKFREFLWFCAGADLQLLRHCPQSERIKEEGIGGVVLATAVLAFLSSSYAFYIIFNPSQNFNLLTLIASISFGFIWSLIIFNLDRFIVSSSGHGDGTEKITLDEFLGAIPRLIMAIIIGFTLSKPLEIRVMQSELDAVLKKEVAVYLYGGIDKKTGEKTEGAIATEEKRWKADLDKAEVDFKDLNEEKKKIKDEIETLSNKLNKAQEDYAKEAQGLSGNGKYGDGPGTRALEKLKTELSGRINTLNENYAAWEKDNASKIEAREKALVNVAKVHADKTKDIEYTADHMGGLVNRIMWGHENFPTVSWALTLLLLSIEVAPILYKLMIRNGPYHYLTENQREIVAARYAIERQANLLAGQRGQQAEVEIYHQAETSLKSTLAHLNSESRLSLQALEKFEIKVSSDIDANPEKYVQMSDPKNKA
jgi:hypothetical protein